MACPLRYRPLATAAIALSVGIALGWALPLLFAFYSAGASVALASLLVWNMPKEKRAMNFKRLFLVLASLLIGVGLISYRMEAFSSVQTIEGKLTGKIVQISNASTGRYLLLSDAAVNGAAVSGKVRLFVSDEKGKQAFQYGERISAKDAYLKPPTGPTNPGGIDKRITLYSIGASYSASANTVVNHGGNGGFIGALLTFRAGLEQTLKTLMRADVYGVVRGMLFGDVSDMDETWLAAYRATGIAHVLAVSGMNVAIIASVVYWLFKKIGIGRWALLLALILQVLYCVMAGFSVSVVRAAIMTGIVLLLKFNGEKADLPLVLSAAAVFSLLLNPFVLFTPSFLLSFGAVLGILLLNPPIMALFNRSKLRDNTVYKYITGAVSVSAAAQLGTLPTQIAFFNSVPLLSVPLNLLIVPLVGVITVGGFVAALAGSIFLPLGVPFAFGVEWLVRFMSGASVFASKLSFALLTVGDLNPLLYVALALGCIAMALYSKERKRARLACIFVSLLLFVVGLVPVLLSGNGAEMTVLDVGEGDALFLRDGNRMVMLDGGRLDDYHDDGLAVVLPFLRSRGIRKLDAIIVSHPHADHCGGFVAVVEQMEVGRIIVGNTKGAEKPFELLLEAAKRRGVEVVTLAEGDVLSVGEMRLHSLGSTKDSKNPNESSLVLLAQYGGIGMLLTGDADGAGETGYLNAVSEAEILKVAHHGSKYGTGKELLNRVRPQVALISVGSSNNYGHPAAQTLERLKAAGAKVYRTDQRGAITIKLKKDDYQVLTFK